MGATQTQVAQAFEAFNLLPETEQHLVYQLMVWLVPDDIATPEDLRDIAIANQELADGKAVDFSDIDWD
ncbi:MAG: hypothetical protein FWE34_05335 [Defluviitaleaceae bacterium]|nr:hypothetical protein [Defluviitaleaceae bacterium]